jgi:hypothetical protein
LLLLNAQYKVVWKLLIFQKKTTFVTELFIATE